MTIDCNTAREWLHDALDERLAAAERRAFDEHVAACGPCASEWESFRGIRATMRALGLPKAPAGLREAISAQVRAEHDATPGVTRVHRFVDWSRRLMIAASLLLAVSLGWWFSDRDRRGSEAVERQVAGAATPERETLALEHDAQKESEPAGESKKQGAAPTSVELVEVMDADARSVSNGSRAPAQTAGLPAVLARDAEARRCLEVARTVARQWASGANETWKSASAPADVIDAGDRGRVAFFLTVLDQGTADLATTVPPTVGAGLEQLTKDADVALLGLGFTAETARKQDSDVKLKSPADDRTPTGPGAPPPGSPGEKGADLRDRTFSRADDQEEAAKTPANHSGGGNLRSGAKAAGDALAKGSEQKSAKSAPSETDASKARGAPPVARGQAAPKSEARPSNGGVAGGGGGGRAGGSPPTPTVRRVDEPMQSAAAPSPGFYAVSGDQAIAKVGRLLETSKLAAREVPLRAFELQSRGQPESRLAFDETRDDALTAGADRAAPPQGRAAVAANAKYRVLEINVPGERFNSIIGDLESLDGVRLVPVGHEPSFAASEGPRLGRQSDGAAARDSGATPLRPGLRTLRLVVLEP